MTVCSVARRHGLTPQQLFTWRRLARKPLGAAPVVEDVPMFAPAVLVPSAMVDAKEPERVRGSRKTETQQAV
ncbi:transposase [Sinorhizobium alkalisoli]|uniref:transposase n=1 Tax=Sinorhizobium alkalisoli TaxID=1752398 RepID=UPI000ACF8C69